MGKDKKQGSGLSDHVFFLRQRLHESLSLGLKYNGEQEMKWICVDAGIESHALKKIDSFISSLTFSLSQNPLIKESISEIVVTLTGILQSKNIATLNASIEATSNLVRKIRTNIREFPILNIISSLSNLLSLNQLSQVTKHSCVTALNVILTNLGVSNQAKIGEILERDNLIGFISIESQGFYKMEYFVELVDLLRVVMSKWPELRFRVWSDEILMKKLEEKCDYKGMNISTNVLKLCSSLALCSHGAKSMLQNKSFISKIIKCLEKHNYISVRIQSFKLLRHLMRSKEGFTLLVNTHCETLINEIINSMRIFYALNEPSQQIPLLLEASRTALVLVSRTGPHHKQFWSKNIGQIIHDIILRKHGNNNGISNNNKRSVLVNNGLSELRKLVWDIFAYLAVYCEEENFEGQFRNFEVLISCACTWAANAMARRFSPISPGILELDDPVCRTVLLMLISPCNYFPRNSLHNLSHHLDPFHDSISNFISRFLHSTQSSCETNSVPDCEIVVDLANLACLSFLEGYREVILRKNGVKVLWRFVERRCESEILVRREKISSYLDNIYEGVSCCCANNDSNSLNEWEGKDLTLLYALICLSKLLETSSCNKPPDSTVRILRNIISNDKFAEGPKMYCKYILSLYGLHGSQSGTERRISKAFDMKEFADVMLLFSDGYSFDAHGVILITRCPKLLPPNSEFPSENNPKMIVKMSDRVDRQALGMVLEYIYSGFIEINNLDDGLIKKIKLIAKNCGLESLVEMVNKDRPKWGSSCEERFDLSGALEPAGFPFSDVILEAKSDERIECKYRSCQLATPHIHAHKIILCLGCDYLRALFRSGMHESLSGTIKVPIGYNALLKLADIFYSNKPPKLNTDCKFKSLTDSQKSTELQSLIELSSLAQYWCWEEIAEEATNSVVDCIARNSVDERGCLRAIGFAKELGQWGIVEGGVRWLAPKYPKLRGGGIEGIGEEVMEMLRVEYVRLL
ncbi:hypothetical protein LUZ60_017354 [Juncus effusus]|nr:hypothetical protein LUZ60_017354 [Juncus effusus]